MFGVLGIVMLGENSHVSGYPVHGPETKYLGDGFPAVPNHHDPVRYAYN